MTNRACNHCGAPIIFTQNARGKWVPTDPDTNKFHRCKLDQVCQGCAVTFQGPPWMKHCSQCYKGIQDARDPHRRGFAQQSRPQSQPAQQKPRSEPVPRETLSGNDDLFDDIPF